jgi:flagellar basal body-associated protein FliL
LIKRYTALLLAALALLTVLAACSDDGGLAFDGANTIQFDLGEEITVNIKDNEENYFYCAPTLNIYDQKDVEVFTAKLSWIRQAIIDIIKEKTLEELKDTSATTMLSDSIVAKLNETFAKDAVYSVTFSKFYVYHS